MKSTHLVRSAALPLLILAGGPSLADPATDLADSVLAVAPHLPEGDVATAAAQALRVADPEAAGEFIPVLAAMGRLAEGAEHPATQIVMRDLHRQILANLVADPATSPLVALVDAGNPMVAEIYLGVGLAQRDVAAGAFLSALHQSLPDTPADQPTDDPALLQTGQAIVADFAGQPPANQQFFARYDAWLVGTVNAWPNLTEDQRRSATGVFLSDQVPSAEVVKAVTGSEDLLGWLGAMDLALTDAERTAEPELLAFLDAGKLTAGVTEQLAARRGAGTNALMGEVAVFGTMMDLNYELLFDSRTPGLADDMLLGN